jgi:hypothetical protein
MNRLQELEQQVLEEGREWTRRRLQERLQKEIDEMGAVCLQSGLMLKKQRRRSIELRTVSGVVELKAWYGYSTAQECWIYPCRQAWNLEPYQRTTPELQSRLCYTAAQVPSYETAARMAARWGSPVSDDLIHGEVQRKGKEADQADWPAPESPKAEPEFSMVIMMDGWMVRERGVDWAKDRKIQSTHRVDWHEIKSAVIYRLEQRAQSESGRGMLLEKYIVARPPETDPVDFGKAVQQEGLRRGLARANQVYVVMDGAVWLWDLAEDRFADSVKTLDFHHASHHLWAIGRAVYGEGTPECKKWVGGLLHQLKHGKEDRVIRRLEQLLEKWEFESTEVQQTLEREVQYFRKHRDHIHYEDRAQEETPIGSGAVESLARQLQNRFKSCGQFWTRKGLTNLLAIVTTFKNQDETYLWN